MSSRRDERQQIAWTWANKCFGSEHCHSIPQRAIRMVEEAIETCQAAECDPAMIHQLVDYVYSRPVGKMYQELGGVGITLLVLASACEISADFVEAEELCRLLSKPDKEFVQRNDDKNAAGFRVSQPRSPKGVFTYLLTLQAWAPSRTHAKTTLRLPWINLWTTYIERPIGCAAIWEINKRQ